MNLRAAGELHPTRDRVAPRRTELFCRERLVPREPISYRREQSTGRDHVVVGHLDVPAVALSRVRLRESGHDVGEVVSPTGVRQAEWFEDSLVGELRE